MKQIIIVLIFLAAVLQAGCAGPEESFVISTARSSEDSAGDLKDPGNEEVHQIAVYICGEVSDPGIYYLDEGSRVADLLNAANGALPNADLKRINLAQRLVDGQQIIVYSLQTAEGQEGAKGESANTGGKININLAGKEELMTLPGIGESKADAIIRYREENGPFSCTEDVMNVSGLKNSVYATIKEQITVQ